LGRADATYRLSGVAEEVGGVERTFSWTDQNRRMSKDYERLTESSEAFIYVAMSRMMARRLACS
jgi:transposase